MFRRETARTVLADVTRPNRATGFMKIEPKPSDREVLAGLVERVTYQNAENGFFLSLLAGQRDFDARHVDPAGDGIRQIARHASAAARHDLDLCRRRKAL